MRTSMPPKTNYPHHDATTISACPWATLRHQRIELLVDGLLCPTDTVGADETAGPLLDVGALPPEDDPIAWETATSGGNTVRYRSPTANEMSQYGWTHEHLLVVLPTTNFTTKVKAAQATATAYLPIHDISQSRPQEDLDLAVIPVSRQWSHNRMPYHEKTYSSTSPRISVLYPTLLGNRERTRVAGRISQTKGVRTCHNPSSRRSSPSARQVRAHGALTFVADLSPPIRALRHPTCRATVRPDLEAQAPVAVPAFYSTSVAGSASSPEARWSSSNRVDDPTNSGGPRAGHSSGASLGKPTWSSIFLATRLSVISAIAFIRAPQLGHSNTSIANTRCMSSGQRSPRLRAGAQLSAARDSTRIEHLAAAFAATSALLGGGPRPSFTTYARMLACGAKHP
jgi:hypothetical protein